MKMLLPLLLALCIQPDTESEKPAPRDSMLVVFWNLENFFDYRSPAKPRYWTRGRFYTKCDAVAKTLMLIADCYGRIPDIVCFAELENGYVLRSLIQSTVLRKLHYSAVHYDSPDHRGIDCGMIYRKGSLQLRNSEPKHIYDSTGVIMATRDILLADFGEFAVLVNHHPSKIGGKTDRREAAMSRMIFIADSLLHDDCRGVLAIGDFNDELWPRNTDRTTRHSPVKVPGTLKYNGKWEKIDGHFCFGDIIANEEIFCHPLLLTEDKTFGGMKPRRTFTGPRYNGGISDHLPVVVWIKLR